MEMLDEVTDVREQITALLAQHNPNQDNPLTMNKLPRRKQRGIKRARVGDFRVA